MLKRAAAPATDVTSPVHVLTPEYYDRLAALEASHWWWRGVRRVTERVLAQSLAPGGRVLDAGCGTGRMLSWIDGQVSAAPVGLDRSEDALRYCRARSHSRLLQGDAVSLPFTAETFDLALSLDVIQHLPRPGGDSAALRDLARVLAPGGRLLLRTNSRCGYPDVDAPDYHRYTLTEVRALLDAGGFTCERLSYVNVAPALALTVWRTLRGRVPDRDPGLPSLPAREGLTGWIGYRCLSLEAEFIRRVPVSLPFGHSILALARKPL
ncbi:MAG TPA: class I SAM-dependent methyltransferase [Vicinamibacterales bacterium]